MRFYCLIFVLPVIFSQRCVMVQVQQKENILARAAEKKETLVKQRTTAALASIRRGEKIALQFKVENHTTTSERQYFHEKVFIENQLTKDDGRIRYLVSWISFAFEAEGAGNYLLYMLGGIPMTLGINIPVALYDWVSMPFRLRAETIERTAHEDKVASKTVQPVADCSRFALRIDEVEHALAPDCSLQFTGEAFTAMTSRHNHLPHFEGAFRYELVDLEKNEVRMNSQVFIMKLKSVEFLERP